MKDNTDLNSTDKEKIKARYVYCGPLTGEDTYLHIDEDFYNQLNPELQKLYKQLD